MNRKRKIVFEAVKNFYCPAELAEEYGIEETELVRKAYLGGAMYQIAGKRLIHRGHMESILQRMKEYGDVKKGKAEDRQRIQKWI